MLRSRVYNDGSTSYGGDQSWFKEEVQEEGGCGPISAANIFVHMALNDPDITAALGVGSAGKLTESSYKDFMERVYQW